MSSSGAEDERDVIREVSNSSRETAANNPANGTDKKASPPESRSRRFSRRDFLKGAGAAALGGGLALTSGSFLTNPPAVHAQSDVTLRVVGTGVTLIEEIRKKAEQDLGINLKYDVKSGISALQKARTQPGAWDLYDQWYKSLKLLWPTGNCQAIETDRLEQWDNVNNLTKTGRVTPDADRGKGGAPYTKQYVQHDDSLGSDETGDISMLPLTHNVDSFGYNSGFINKPSQPYTISWSQMLNSEHSGKVGLLNTPYTGPFDAALAVEAKGVMDFQDIGNMSRDEIDEFMNYLSEKKREGHFRAFWGSFTESVNLMASGEVVIESMWSPAATALLNQGVPVVYAAPREGYRGWHGGICLNANLSGRKLEAAYDYLNWWLNGWAGAYVARQGYYFSIPENVKPHLSEAEWNYWYEGEVATKPLKSPAGKVIIQPGTKRNGGSYWERLSHIAVWSSVMDEWNYLVRRWNEFLAI